MSILSLVCVFREHIRHPLDLQRKDLSISISLRDQKTKLFAHSFFCGTIVAVLGKSITQMNKAGFVLLAVSISGISFLLMTLALKIQRVYVEMNRRLSESQTAIEGFKKENQELSEKVKGLEKRTTKEGELLVIEELMKYKFSLNKNIDLADGTSETVDKLIQDYQLDVNTVLKWDCTEESETTLLLTACSNDLQPLILKLLDRGVDPSYKDKKGNNCLHTLLQNGSLSDDFFTIIDFILKRFPDLINVKTADGCTPLDLAIFARGLDFEISELLKRLLKAGADINAVDNHGYTPFDKIIEQEDTKKLIELLIVPELKIDKCKDQGDYLIENIIVEELFNESSLIDKLLERQGWGLKAQQHLIHFVCDEGLEELLQKILKKWACEDKGQNHFLNKKALYEGEEAFPLQRVVEKNALDQAKKQRMINSLLKYTDVSKWSWPWIPESTD